MSKSELVRLAVQRGEPRPDTTQINTWRLLESSEGNNMTAREGWQACAEQKDAEIAEQTKLAKSYLDSANVWHDRYMKRCADNESLRQQQGVAIMAVEEELQELTDHINKVWADTYPDAVPADTMIALKNRIKNLAEDRACWVFNARVLQNKLNSLEIK